jgi:hypothetical protein
MAALYLTFFYRICTTNSSGTNALVTPSAFYWRLSRLSQRLVCVICYALTQPLPFLSPLISRAQVQFKLGCAGSGTCESNSDQKCTAHVDCIGGSECAIIASCLLNSSPLLFFPFLSLHPIPSHPIPSHSSSSSLLSSRLFSSLGGFVYLLFYVISASTPPRLQHAREMCQLLRMRIEQRRHRRALFPPRMHVEQQDDCQATLRIR